MAGTRLGALGKAQSFGAGRRVKTGRPVLYCGGVLASLMSWPHHPAPCALQEACLGGELFDLILEKGHFTERDAAQIVGVVLQVIEHCHLQGVIHRGGCVHWELGAAGLGVGGREGCAKSV